MEYNKRFVTNQDYLLLLAARIKSYRIRAKMSQKEMAKEANMGTTTLAHFEQGANKNMTLNNFISLLRAVGMEKRLNDLLPELPIPDDIQKQINKMLAKRIKKND